MRSAGGSRLAQIGFLKESLSFDAVRTSPARSARPSAPRSRRPTAEEAAEPCGDAVPTRGAKFVDLVNLSSASCPLTADRLLSVSATRRARVGRRRRLGRSQAENTKMGQPDALTLPRDAPQPRVVIRDHRGHFRPYLGSRIGFGPS